MKLIVVPDDGVAPILAAITGAKKTIEIAIFRFDHKRIEKALIDAVGRGVRVTALIAFANRGGETSLRKLELRFLDAGIIVARTNGDLIRYHNKYLLVDGKELLVLSTNYTHLDIEHSRGFAIATTHAEWTTEAFRLFRADCSRAKYKPKSSTFIVSPLNARQTLGDFLKRAKKELLIYDPQLTDKEMLRILQEREKAGVDVRIIGTVPARAGLDAQRLGSMRLHTRTIIRDRHQAFIGSQSLREQELDKRRELGLIIHDSRAVKKLTDVFEKDWDPERSPKTKTEQEEKAQLSQKESEKAAKALAKDLNPIVNTMKKAVKRAVAKAGTDALDDESMKKRVKTVVKKAMKAAVREAVKETKATAKRGKSK
jgi:phosphatidylserine/phosphatidylglycerophosphate/cardiolipin synthase-like enzyme